ncbi:hypothetical protein CFI11_14930 [Thalassococcus sp. S3]|nr:hypothetical protein [Thalassococcus sp. S3]QBF32500.1 hypothetical protein CFI11_14930 [Thalassococcus sp. S3]
MGYPTKIATCCYCGTRAALVLNGRDRHELSCSACGAPLHDLKRLRKDKHGERDLVAASRARKQAPVYREVPRKPPKPKKRKRRKSILKKVFEEAFDVIEDILD